MTDIKCQYTCLCLHVWYISFPLRPRWGYIAVQMGERVKTCDGSRADHSQRTELLTLIISHSVDVGLSFVLCSINCPTLPGMRSTVSSLFRSGATDTLRLHTKYTGNPTHTHTIFLVTLWLLVHSVQWLGQVEVQPARRVRVMTPFSLKSPWPTTSHTHAYLEELLLKCSRIV